MCPVQIFSSGLSLIISMFAKESASSILVLYNTFFIFVQFGALFTHFWVFFQFQFILHYHAISYLLLYHPFLIIFIKLDNLVDVSFLRQPISHYCSISISVKHPLNLKKKSFVPVFAHSLKEPHLISNIYHSFPDFFSMPLNLGIILQDQLILFSSILVRLCLSLTECFAYVRLEKPCLSILNKRH